MNDTHCETNCQKDLIDRINKKVPTSSVWKFVTIAVIATGVLWSASYAIYAGGVGKREAAIEQTQKDVVEIKVNSAKTQEAVEHIKRGNERLEYQNIQIILELKTLIKEVKENG